MTMLGRWGRGVPGRTDLVAALATAMPGVPAGAATSATTRAAPLAAGYPKPFPWAEYGLTTANEVHDVRTTKKNRTGLDKDNLASAGPNDPTSCLTGANLGRYEKLSAATKATIASAEPQNACAASGAGNTGMVVDDLDVAGWKAFRGTGPGAATPTSTD